MARFSPTEAAFEGFRLTREHPRAVLAWALAYFFYTLALAILTISWIGPDFAAFSALSHSANPDPAELAHAFEKIGPYLLVVIPLQVVFFAVLNCAIYRAVLRPFESGTGYLRLGRDEFRMVAVIAMLFMIWLAILFVVSVVVTLAAGTIGVFGGAPGALIGVVVDVAVFCLAIWVLVRLSLAGPMTFDQRRLVVFGSWSFTRTAFWPLTGAYILASLLGGVIVALMMVISSGIIAAAFMATGGTLAGLSQNVQTDISTLHAFLTLPTLLSQALGSAMVVFYFVIALSPSAIAYQGLIGEGRTDAAMLV
ncbi:MAG: hypothetical protein P4L73_06560 [Caulobacteraceae bacterium]|nr:hypothetical protein [Caulobacteraceae bacterium]